MSNIKVKFIAYDGEYPNLCAGALEIEVNGESYILDHILISGGRVWFDEDWEDHVDKGMWSVNLSDYPELQQYEDEITDIVNENIPYGCCGGCI